MCVVARGGPVTRALPSLRGTHLDGGIEMLRPELWLGDVVIRKAATAQFGEHPEAEVEPIGDKGGAFRVEREFFLGVERGQRIAEVREPIDPIGDAEKVAGPLQCGHRLVSHLLSVFVDQGDTLEASDPALELRGPEAAGSGPEPHPPGDPISSRGQSEIGELMQAVAGRGQHRGDLAQAQLAEPVATGRRHIAASWRAPSRRPAPTMAAPVQPSRSPSIPKTASSDAEPGPMMAEGKGENGQRGHVLVSLVGAIEDEKAGKAMDGPERNEHGRRETGGSRRSE